MEKTIKALINDLKPMITEPGDAMLIVPLLKEYLDLGIKNDEHLIKMAGIVQRAILNAESNGGDFVISDAEKEQLFRDLDKMPKN
jgi:hypothetical protein